MVPIDPSWFLALPLLFILGWFSARLDRRQQQTQRQLNLQPLEKAIQALSAANPDEALKQLLIAVREGPDMLGLQRAIADLYRQKGQSDRAIEVRLSILARKSISTELEQALLLELAHDYMAAGIFDRAQASAQASLALAKGDQAEPCLRLMLPHPPPPLYARCLTAGLHVGWLGHTKPPRSPPTSSRDRALCTASAPEALPATRLLWRV